MARSLRSTDTSDATDLGTYPGTPLWAKLCGGFVLALIVLVAVMLIVGGGSHDPGRHAPSGDAGGRTMIADVVSTTPHLR